jgi:hypothetical protein
MEHRREKWDESRQKLAGQTLIWCNVSTKGYMQPHLYGLLPKDNKTSLLSWFCCLPAALLIRGSTFLASPNSWVLLYIWGFTLIAAPITLSGAACRDSDPATYGLASQIFLWKLGGSFHDPITLIFCRPEKPALYKWCQSLPPGRLWLLWPLREGLGN